MSVLGRLAVTHGLRSRDAKWELYRKLFPPQHDQRVLDVGVSSLDHLPGENAFLKQYPWTLTAVGIQDMKGLESRYPHVNFEQADGRDLPFPDDKYDVVHSNAVVEHVGHYDQQQRFINELCRVAHSGFVTTPSRWFPIETHTRVPFLHWLPRPLMLAALKAVGRYDDGFWLLSRHQFVALFPPTVSVRVFRTRILGWPVTTIVAFTRRPS